MPGPGGMDDVALSLAAFGQRGPAGRKLAVATVAEAVGRGVRRLDLTDGPELELALSIVAEARPPAAESLTLFVPSGHVARTPTVPFGDVRIVEVLEQPGRRAGVAAQADGEFGVRWSADAPGTPAPPAERAKGLRWLVVRASLIQAPRLLHLAPAAGASGFRLLLTDPFAGGLLSGGGPVGPWSEAGRPSTPWDVASLRRAYAPVLRLEFLTAGKKRTLPQAAVAFARSLGAVVSLPARDRADLDAWLDPARSAALSDVELARLREFGDTTEPGAPA